MLSAEEKEVFSIIESFNRTFVEAKDFSHLGNILHERMVTVPPGFKQRAEGKEANLKTYQDFGSSMTIHKMTETDPHVDIFGSTAVATYQYGCDWEYQGSRFDEDGHEVIVFHRDDTDWKIAWRTILPGKRRVDGIEGEATNDCPSTDLRKRCLSLVANSQACHLTTIDELGFPHTTAMNNLRFKQQYPELTWLFKDQANHFVLYMTTHMDSNKMARLQANPKASAYFCDAPQFHGLMLGGEIEVVTDQALKEKIWQEGWHMYYPNGPEGPEYGVLKLVPKVAKGWSSTGAFELDV